MRAHEQRGHAEGRGRAPSPVRTSPVRTPAAPAPVPTGAASPAALLSLQRTAGNAAATRVVHQERQAGGAVVQRVPSDAGQAAAPAPAAEPRSYFSSDSDTVKEKDKAAEAKATAEDDTVLPYHRSLRGLRGLIRRAMDAEKNAAKGKGKGKRASAKDWTVTVKIDPGASWTSREFLGGEVGHVWLALTSPLGESTQFGFYPKTEASAINMQGEIICPDRHGGDTEQKTASLGLQDVLSGYRAAHARANARYNLAAYNCASFASDIWKAMTGSPLPNGLLIPNPASAADSVRSERQLRSAFSGQQMTSELEDLIGMASSGSFPPAL